MPDRSPIHHFYGVTVGAARDLLMLAHLSFEFGPRNALYQTEALQHALQGMFGEHLPSSHLGEVDLIEVLLLQAANSAQYRVCVLQRASTPDAGWVCLIPAQHLEELRRVVQKYHLHSETLD